MLLKTEFFWCKHSLIMKHVFSSFSHDADQTYKIWGVYVLTSRDKMKIGMSVSLRLKSLAWNTLAQMIWYPLRPICVI